ncbi:MAG: hypothetical protein IT350_12325 [Deltaproteobacteria bacterium]|nr:hypothetical protein [Deltaproteobacteria bacterium]
MSIFKSQSDIDECDYAGQSYSVFVDANFNSEDVVSLVELCHSCRLDICQVEFTESRIEFAAVALDCPVLQDPGTDDKSRPAAKAFPEGNPSNHVHAVRIPKSDLPIHVTIYTQEPETEEACWYPDVPPLPAS